MNITQGIILENFKHLSFDLWLTLIKSHPDFKLKRSELFKNFFKIPNSLEEIHFQIKKWDDRCNSMNETTGLNLNTFEIYLLILAEFDIYPDRESLEEFYLESEKLFLEFPPLALNIFDEEFFIKVKDLGITTNILSNTGFIKGETLNKVISTLPFGKYIDFKIYSDETGYSKPNPLMFEEIKNNIDYPISGSEILHIGDNPFADVEGATKAGLQAYLVKI